MNDEREDAVGRWIRLAGRRPVPEPDRARRVREEVRGVWLDAVRRERRARFLRRAGGLAAAAALAGLVAAVVLLRGGPGVSAPSPSAPRVAARAGDVRVVDVDGSAVEASVGRAVPWGGTIRTGSAGRVALALPNGASLRLDVDTVARAASLDTAILERGALYVDSGAEGTVPAPALTVRTPRGTVRDVGTRFEVRVGPDGDRVTVRVRDGAVELRDAAGPGRRLVPRETSVVWGPDGWSAPAAVGPADPAWDWTLRVAPVPGIDGKPLRSFLDWAAREGGWTLAFADAETAREAANVTLGGSIEGLSVSAALEAVLPTCGMRHRIEDGFLRVRRVEDP